MIKICKRFWDKNQNKLRDTLNDMSDIDGCDYKSLVKLAIDKIMNDDSTITQWDIDHITEIDNGDYQGTLLYLIPEKTYQPSEFEYLMACVGYGSCSGCDTLQSIQCGCGSEEGKINDYMTLCRDIISTIIKPYNCGWREDKEYEAVEPDGVFGEAK